MPAEIYQDSVDLECETLEAEYPTPEKAGLFRDIYPYPLLLRTGRSAVMTFQAIHLENELIKATILPDLGGRIIGLHDKRTKTDVLPRVQKLTLDDSGPRLAWCAQGIQFSVGPAQRLNSLGPVEFQVREPEEEDDDAGVILFEIISGTRIGWQAVIALSPNSPTLRIQLTAQNRNFKAAYVESGLMLPNWPICKVSPNRSLIYLGDPDRSAGLVAKFRDSEFAEVQRAPFGTSLVRMGASSHGVLLGRQSDSWNIELSPLTGLDDVDAVSETAAVKLGSNSLQLGTQITRPSTDAYLQLANEESLKATLDLYAEQPLNVELGELAAAPTAFALIDGDKSRLLEWSSVQPMYKVEEGESMWLLRTDRAEGTSIPNSEADWQVALTHHEAGSEESMGRIHALRRDGAYRHLVSLLDAVRSLRESDNGTAIDALDTAIGFSADDALLWWLKALVLRLSGEEAEERPELPNAHFLSPLEPVLRAEAFLAQPQTHAKEGSPLIKPMANNPEAMIEVAVLLLESGLRMEAARWIDECLRHRNEPILQYLAAWNLMTASRMEAEAAQHVRTVAQAGWEPPFPWRNLERRAIRELAERFSSDERLQKLKALVEAF